MDAPGIPWTKPSVAELGPDLLRVSPTRRAIGLASPFALFIAYFLFAAADHPTLAILSVVALSFVTYGSVSHDLVHANLGLPPRLNRRLLSIIELLMLRSGTVYRAVHLNHHSRYPDPRDDPEGAAARFGLFRTLWEGVIFQFKLGRWVWRRASPGVRRRALAEWVAIGALVSAAAAASPFTRIPLAYCALVYAGSWIIPLVTSYLVHDPGADHELRQTRLFRGAFYSLVALDHLYHLEHHLYPQVPHHNWKRLARRLDPHFQRAGIAPRRVF
jgi:beta-carotene hydroxylase